MIGLEHISSTSSAWDVPGPRSGKTAALTSDNWHHAKDRSKWPEIRFLIRFRSGIALIQLSAREQRELRSSSAMPGSAATAACVAAMLVLGALAHCTEGESQSTLHASQQMGPCPALGIEIICSAATCVSRLSASVPALARIKKPI